MLAAEESVEASPAPVADTDEPPATPPPAAVPSPAAAYTQAVAPTPTGLGLSSLAPLSPIGGPICLSANTPAVTPLHGMPPTSTHKSKVYDTLHAAAQVGGGAIEFDVPWGNDPALNSQRLHGWQNIEEFLLAPVHGRAAGPEAHERQGG